jgi:hypothetical protein
MIDKRTRAGQEAVVLDEVRGHGGFTVFWATETAQRAAAIERLELRGALRRIDGCPYPRIQYEVDEGRV